MKHLCPAGHVISFAELDCGASGRIRIRWHGNLAMTFAGSVKGDRDLCWQQRQEADDASLHTLCLRCL